MNKVKFILLAVGFGLALDFIFSCSSDSPSGPSGGESSPNQEPSSSSAYSPPPSSSSSVVVISSSSSVVVGTQYYDVTLGNWSISCPNLDDYPELLNKVISITDDSRNFMQTCLINPEYYTGNTGSQVANFLATNGLSGYANEFDSRIAVSSYNAAYLIYVNTNNYYRVLIISYSGTNLLSSSSSSTPTPSTCDLKCTQQILAAAGAGLQSSWTCDKLAQCGTTCKANYDWCSVW
jgi:hypothetical protein